VGWANLNWTATKKGIYLTDGGIKKHLGLHSAGGDEDGRQREWEREKSSLYVNGTKQGFLQKWATTPDMRKVSLFGVIFVKSGFVIIPSNSRVKKQGWDGNINSTIWS